MGLFSRKEKKNAVIVRTFTQSLNEEIKKEDTKIASYERLKPRLAEFIKEYKHYFTNDVTIYGDLVQIQFNKKFTYGSQYPDGFYALADKLGLNIEPNCGGGYYGGLGGGGASISSFNVRAKSK